MDGWYEDDLIGYAFGSFLPLSRKNKNNQHNYRILIRGIINNNIIYLSKMCDWSTSSVNPLLECLSYGNHECLPIKELSHTVTKVSSVINVCNNPLVPDLGGLKNTIGCLLSVIYKQRIVFTANAKHNYFSTYNIMTINDTST